MDKLYQKKKKTQYHAGINMKRAKLKYSFLVVVTYVSQLNLTMFVNEGIKSNCLPPKTIRFNYVTHWLMQSHD